MNSNITLEAQKISKLLKFPNEKFKEFLFFFKWPCVEDYKNNKNMIFVFGSNIEGIHGAGAAKFAKDYLEAQLGIGEGFTGQTYALPTKVLGEIKGYDQLGLIKASIFSFFGAVLENISSPKIYVFTPVGTGLSGIHHEVITNLIFEKLESLSEQNIKDISERVMFSSEFKFYFEKVLGTSCN
ncbi:MAG: hypothetical protein EBU90_01700 [Proteobacteria bacterium]|nr:hypothetical protein [Pseudomonadota bacterium]